MDEYVGLKQGKLGFRGGSRCGLRALHRSNYLYEPLRRNQIIDKEHRNEHHEENVDISDIQLSVGFGESVCAAVERPGRFQAS